MTLSARNHLTGTIDEIQLGDVLALVTVRGGEHEVESVITRRKRQGDVAEEGRHWYGRRESDRSHDLQGVGSHAIIGTSSM